MVTCLGPCHAYACTSQAGGAGVGCKCSCAPSPPQPHQAQEGQAHAWPSVKEMRRAHEQALRLAHAPSARPKPVVPHSESSLIVWQSLPAEPKKMEYDVDLRGQQHGSSLVAIPATQAGAPPLYKAPSCASKAAPCEPLARVEPAAQREKTSCSRECGFQGLDEDLVLHETKCIRARLTKQNGRLN